MSLACEALGLPVVSGNVSLYNEHFGQPIYPTPVVGVVGVLADAELAVKAGFRSEGDLVLLAGDGVAALDGSEYQKLVLGEVAGRIPAPDLVAEARLHRFLAEAAERRLLRSAHDVADGGLAVTLAESAIAGGIGRGCRLRRSPSRRAMDGPWSASASGDAEALAAAGRRAPAAADRTRRRRRHRAVRPDAAAGRGGRDLRVGLAGCGARAAADVRRVRHLRPARRARP